MSNENFANTKISLYTATAIVAANMIGTGVFTSLGFQVFDIQTGFSILALWIIGGIAALCGALSYGELSAAMPRSGGEYHLLSKIYHPSVGFLSGWVSVAVGFSAPIAAAAMAMGKYFSQVLIDSGIISADSLITTKILTALVGVTLVSIVHLFNVKVVSKFQIVFTALKISLIVGLVIFGFILATGQPISFLPATGDFKTIFSSPFAVSLVFVMYAYSGWNAAVYIASDIKNPGRNLPLSLIWGTLIVILLYVPVNAVFLYSAPIAEMMGQEDVGYIAANHIFGTTGGSIMGILITIGLISAISSMVWAGPRVTQVMGEDVKILKFLSVKNRNGVPHISLVLQYLVVVLLILTSSFEAIIKYIGVMLSLSSFLTVFGVFILRYRQPNLQRPYRTWGYPVTPIVFMLVTGWMMFFVIRNEPSITIACIATIAVGLVLYYINGLIEKKR